MLVVVVQEEGGDKFRGLWGIRSSHTRDLIVYEVGSNKSCEPGVYKRHGMYIRTYCTISLSKDYLVINIYIYWKQ